MLKDFRKDTWDDVKECAKKKKMYLFGAGEFGQHIWRELKKYQTVWDIAGFIDNDTHKHGKEICGLNVYSANILADIDINGIIILICSMKTADIAVQLHKAGVQNYFSVFFLDLPDEVRDTCYQPDISTANIEWLRKRMSDNESKQVIDKIVEKRKAGFFDYTDIRSSGSEYFIDEIFKIEEEEILIDGGGYDGDTIEEFVNYTKGKFKRIYSFEPQKDKAEIIEEKIWRYGDRIRLYKKGLYDCEKEIGFSNGNAALSGKIIEGEESEKIWTIDLDSAVDEAVSFIKMDIEGAELKALQGAADTIKKYKPKLAICIYHKPEDLWDIPRYIDSLVPEYKFYIRHFGWRYTSTILYCTL